MESNSQLVLKVCRQLYFKLFQVQKNERQFENDPNKASEIIYNALVSEEPCMISRFGANELSCLSNYVSVEKKDRNIFKFIKGNIDQWWWNENILENMKFNAGFFPLEIPSIIKFSKLMLKDMEDIDILGSWLHKEKYFKNDLLNVKKIQLLLLEPFWSKEPWTRALKGKKVLIVHPFSETIESQYKRRDNLFKNDLLPDFELKTLKSVQSMGGQKTKFKDWFEALEYMKNRIDQYDYDVCIIGAGAYGLSLAAHVKRQGKKGFHMGGSLQLLFGIKGKRWEDNYISEFDYLGLMNEHWTRPSNSETPVGSEKIEKGCYW